jgi:hypothetical protein
MLDHIRDIAEEICRDVTGREYCALSEPSAITDLFRKATIVRYLRDGIEPHWIDSATVEEMRRFV